MIGFCLSKPTNGPQFLSVSRFLCAWKPQCIHILYQILGSPKMVLSESRITRQSPFHPLHHHHVTYHGNNGLTGIPMVAPVRHSPPLVPLPILFRRLTIGDLLCHGFRENLKDTMGSNSYCFRFPAIFRFTKFEIFIEDMEPRNLDCIWCFEDFRHQRGSRTKMVESMCLWIRTRYAGLNH